MESNSRIVRIRFTFFLTVTNSDITDPTTKVLLEVWDNDLTSKDDLMCRLVLPLSQFESPSSEKNKWFQLETTGKVYYFLFSPIFRANSS